MTRRPAELQDPDRCPDHGHRCYRYEVMTEREARRMARRLVVGAMIREAVARSLLWVASLPSRWSGRRWD